MHLYEEFNKLHPEQPAAGNKQADPINLTFEDMKKYFEGMKESLMNEFKKQIQELKTSEQPEEALEDNNPTDNLDNKEENENGSSTDL